MLLHLRAVSVRSAKVITAPLSVKVIYKELKEFDIQNDENIM